MRWQGRHRLRVKDLGATAYREMRVNAVVTEVVREAAPPKVFVFPSMSEQARRRKIRLAAAKAVPFRVLLERQRAVLDEDPGVGLLDGDRLVRDEQGVPEPTRPNRLPEHGDVRRRGLPVKRRSNLVPPKG